MIVCLCDAFSRPQHPSAVRRSPRSSPSLTPKVASAGGDDTGAGDADSELEPSDGDVRFLPLQRMLYTWKAFVKL